MSDSTHAFLKYVSLLALLLQNCLVIILTRVVKQRDVEVQFVSSAAVLFAEVIKFVFCAAILLFDLQDAIRDAGSFSGAVRNAVTTHGISTLKCAVPALCYTIQNNLIYYALSNLEVVIFQLLYQTKLLLTAALSVCILSKKLAGQQWVSLCLLFLGVVIVQLSGKKGGGHEDVSAARQFNGAVAAIVGSALSAFAGVYFELILKGDMKVSLWTRNVQLCLFTVPISIATVYGNDGEAVNARGIFGGFDYLVWSVVLTQAFGGLIVASCMKYADNIMKNFASSGAIILGAAASVFFFGFEITLQFAVGAALVIVSMAMYDPSLCDCGVMPDPPHVGSALSDQEEVGEATKLTAPEMTDDEDDTDAA